VVDSITAAVDSTTAAVDSTTAVVADSAGTDPYGRASAPQGLSEKEQRLPCWSIPQGRNCDPLIDGMLSSSGSARLEKCSAGL